MSEASGSTSKSSLPLGPPPLLVFESDVPDEGAITDVLYSNSSAIGSSQATKALTSVVSSDLAEMDDAAESLLRPSPLPPLAFFLRKQSNRIRPVDFFAASIPSDAPDPDAKMVAGDDIGDVEMSAWRSTGSFWHPYENFAKVLNRVKPCEKRVVADKWGIRAYFGDVSIPILFVLITRCKPTFIFSDSNHMHMPKIALRLEVAHRTPLGFVSSCSSYCAGIGRGGGGAPKWQDGFADEVVQKLRSEWREAYEKTPPEWLSEDKMIITLHFSVKALDELDWWVKLKAYFDEVAAKNAELASKGAQQQQRPAAKDAATTPASLGSPRKHPTRPSLYAGLQSWSERWPEAAVAGSLVGAIPSPSPLSPSLGSSLATFSPPTASLVGGGGVLSRNSSFYGVAEDPLPDAVGATAVDTFPEPPIIFGNFPDWLLETMLWPGVFRLYSHVVWMWSFVLLVISILSLLTFFNAVHDVLENWASLAVQLESLTRQLQVWLGPQLSATLGSFVDVLTMFPFLPLVLSCLAYFRVFLGEVAAVSKLCFMCTKAQGAESAWSKLQKPFVNIYHYFHNFHANFLAAVEYLTVFQILIYTICLFLISAILFLLSYMDTSQFVTTAAVVNLSGAALVWRFRKADETLVSQVDSELRQLLTPATRHRPITLVFWGPLCLSLSCMMLRPGILCHVHPHCPCMHMRGRSSCCSHFRTTLLPLPRPTCVFFVDFCHIDGPQ
jgi:hypothetical protein